MIRYRLDRRAKLILIILLVFCAALFKIDWDKGIIHTGGRAVLSQLLSSMLRPEISMELIQRAAFATWQTFSYALISILISIVMAIIMAVLSTGILCDNKIVVVFFRALTGFLRAVHELVWAWLFVAAVGLSPVAAIFALAIPYSGALAKVYADTMLEVDKNKISALRIAGASNLQLLIYVYIPEAFGEMMAYSIYRLECAVRSSSVLSFVGLGGLGFQIQLCMNDLNYSWMWIFVYFLIALVLFMEVWGNVFRASLNRAYSKIRTYSIVLFIVLSILSLAFISIYDAASIGELFNLKNAEYLMKFVKGLLGEGEKVPAYLNGGLWLNALKLSFDTIVMSIIAIGIAFIVVILTMLSAADNTKNKELKFRQSVFSRLLFYITRAFYVVSRAVPELLWAMIFVFLFKPGIVPGALALAVHNIGVLGKLCCEVIEEMDYRAVNNLRLSGASKAQVLLYAVIPEIMSKIINYTLYRWEIIIRTTIVVGFVGTGGLGVAFKLAMSFFRYSEISLYILCYIIIVYMAEIISYASKKYIAKY